MWAATALLETLTVVIFVLVFSKLRGFGDLSSRAIKARDAIVAVAAGALVTTLVLFIGGAAALDPRRARRARRRDRAAV